MRRGLATIFGMAIDLRDKPICITGASSGIGLATAVACAQAGMPVVVGARRLDRLRSLVSQIESAGGRAAAVELDVRDADASSRLVDTAVERFGSVHAVFANAGYGVEKPIHAMTDAEIREIFETNFFGTLNTIRPAIPKMIEAKSGHIIICSSCLSRMPIPFFSAYSASKSAQHHISRAMNLELARHGIRVSSVHPIGTKTEFFDTAAMNSGGDGHELVQHTSSLFVQTPERVARAIVRGLRRPAPEIWTSHLVRLGMTFAEAMPRMTDLFLRRMVHERHAKDSRKRQ